jgi:uncharacterized protein YebE (UPF0316 family)
MSLDTLGIICDAWQKIHRLGSGFFKQTVFVVAITCVLSNLDIPLNILGFAAGFATGYVVGMTIVERLAIGHTHMRIISSRLGTAIAERLRDEGYAVTEIPARGKDGMVSMLNVSVLRKNIDKVAPWQTKLTLRHLSPQKKFAR